MRDEWRSVTMRPGALSVMNTGQPMLPMWSADNWDSWILVIDSTSRVIIIFSVL